MSWDWFKKLTESAEEKKQRQLNELAQTEDFRKMLREEANKMMLESKRQEAEEKNKAKAEHKTRIKNAEDNLKTIGTEMQDSPEPFVNVLSIGFTPENGIEVKLDYNKAFIRYLNTAGIKATNDEETIRLWLAHLNYDISEEAKAQDYLMHGVSEDEMPPMNYDEMFGKDDDDEEKPNSGWEQPTV